MTADRTIDIVIEVDTSRVTAALHKASHQAQRRALTWWSGRVNANPFPSLRLFRWLPSRAPS